MRVLLLLSCAVLLTAADPFATWLPIPDKLVTWSPRSPKVDQVSTLDRRTLIMIADRPSLVGKKADPLRHFVGLAQTDHAVETNILMVALVSGGDPVQAEEGQAQMFASGTLGGNLAAALGGDGVSCVLLVVTPHGTVETVFKIDAEAEADASKAYYKVRGDMSWLMTNRIEKMAINEKLGGFLPVDFSPSRAEAVVYESLRIGDLRKAMDLAKRLPEGKALHASMQERMAVVGEATVKRAATGAKPWLKAFATQQAKALGTVGWKANAVQKDALKLAEADDAVKGEIDGMNALRNLLQQLSTAKAEARSAGRAAAMSKLQEKHSGTHAAAIVKLLLGPAHGNVE